MALSRLSPSFLAVTAALVAALLAAPAAAQFGSIFSDEPPRPPANVPSAPPAYQRQPQYNPPPQPAPNYYPSQNYPRQAAPPRPVYESQVPRPPADIRSDVPPSQPLPAPMSLPPSSRPGGGTIQTQDLAPPPGTEPTPAPQQAQPAQPGQTAPAQPGVARTMPGVIPGLPQPADISAPPTDEVVVEPPPQRIANPTAVFSGLDKITGRITSFDVTLNETVQFGALQVTPRVCYSRPPTETPNTDAFVEVDEVTLQGEIKRIFTGWMFAASPGLHAIEHPIYDVWLTDCKGGRNPAVAEAPEAASTAKPATRPAPRRAPLRR